MTSDALYHVGFGRSDLPEPAPTFAFLSGDPDRAALVAQRHLDRPRLLSDHRGLVSYVGWLGAVPVLSCTSGMGAPSTSIVVNELAQLGVTSIVRIGTTGSIQADVPPGAVIVSHAALCRQGAANDIAPVEYPAAAAPFLAVAVDTFFEGQERSASSANPYLLRSVRGMTEEYRNLNILNFEMEAGFLFKQALVYGIAAGCVLAVVAQRTTGEQVVMDVKDVAIDNAIAVALEGARRWTTRPTG